MRNCLIILLFISGISLAFVNDTNNISQRIKQQCVTLEQKLKLEALHNKHLKKCSKLEIKAYPMYYIKSDFSTSELNYKDLDFDESQSLCFATFNCDSTIYFLDTYPFNRKDLQIGLLLKKQSKYQLALAKALSKSDVVFFLFVLTDKVVCYVENEKLYFIDSNLNTFNTLQSLIEYRYVSVDQYKKEINRFEFEKNFLNQIKTLNDAKLFFRSYSLNYLKYDVFDSLKIANAVIADVEYFVGITSYQKQMLKLKLMELHLNKVFF